MKVEITVLKYFLVISFRLHDNFDVPNISKGNYYT